MFTEYWKIIVIMNYNSLENYIPKIEYNTVDDVEDDVISLKSYKNLLF